jgi:hypothetical protein
VIDRSELQALVARGAQLIEVLPAEEFDLGSAPITTSDGKLVGLLYRDDAIRAADGCPGCARKMI